MADQHQKKSESLEDFEEISPSSVEMIAEKDKYQEENRKLKEEIGELNAKLNENSTEQANPLEAMKKLASDISFATNKMKSKIRELESSNLADGQGKLVNSNEGNKNVGILDYTALKKSIWNERECARNLAISEDGLVVSHKGYFGFGSIRGNIPIKIDLECPNEYIACFFEVHIRSAVWEQENNQNAAVIFIGFCSDQFALGEEAIGKGKNSVGICGKHGVHIDGFLTRYSKEGARSRKYSDGKYFWREGDVVGCGLICFPAQGTLKCFFTCNGDVLEWRRSSMVLPSKFARMQLFPAVSLNRNGTCISANFGQDGWRYDASQHLKRFSRDTWF